MPTCVDQVPHQGVLAWLQPDLQAAASSTSSGQVLNWTQRLSQPAVSRLKMFDVLDAMVVKRRLGNQRRYKKRSSLRPIYKDRGGILSN